MWYFIWFKTGSKRIDAVLIDFLSRIINFEKLNFAYCEIPALCVLAEPPPPSRYSAGYSTGLIAVPLLSGLVVIPSVQEVI